MPDPRDLALSAWMMAIADHGWHGASLSLAAQGAGLSRADVMREIGDRHDALNILADRAARSTFIAATGDGSVRERLFDGLMAGLDELQARRGAVLAIAGARDPGIVLLLGPMTAATLRRLADAAGIDSRGPRGAARMIGLAALSLALFRAWMQDESSDMAATMAELDRLLDRAERAEVDGVSPSLLGLPAFPNPFARARGSEPDPPAE